MAEGFSRYRDLPGPWKWVVRILSIIALAASINQIFYLNLGLNLIQSAYLALLLLLFTPIIFLISPARKKDREHIPWYDLALAFLSTLGPAYYCFNAQRALIEAWEFNSPLIGVILSTITLFVLLEAGRRVVSWMFALIMGVFAFYPLFASHMPGILWGMGWDFSRLASYHFGSQESIMGIPMIVLGNLLIGFMVFAVGLQVTGSGRFFLDLSLSLAGRSRGSPAKVGVIASGLFGSISGSPVANVLTVGQLTIPAMVKGGYSPVYAGAVEACASTGGVLMPPVMGVAAFIMAEILEIPYAKVVIAAIIPSFLYYMALFIQVDAQAALRGIRGIDKDIALPRFIDTTKQGWYFIVSLLVLIWMLLVEMRESQAPFYGVAALFVLTALRHKTRITREEFWKFIEGSGAVLAELTVILACVGLIIGSLTMTGVSLSVSREIVDMAGGNRILLLILSAFAAFVLGMGVPLAPAYVILAIIVTPALVSVGFNTIAAHMFALYWATLSFLTPPVAIAAFAAAGISRASPMATGWMSVRVGSVLFILPFFFILEPALVFQASAFDVSHALISAIIGIFCWTGGLEGYLLGLGKLNIPRRILAFVAGVLLMFPGWITDLAGVVILVFLVLIRIFRAPGAVLD